MKRYFPYVIGIVLGVLLAIVFSAGRASALGPPCFTDTNGHLFETFICWMFDNGLTVGYGDGTFGPDDNITRGQMAVFLQRMRSLGNTYINASPDDWKVNGSSATPYIYYYTNATYFYTSVAGSYLFQLSFDVPSSLYNTLMYTNGAQLCYDATHGATLSTVYVRHYSSTGSILEQVTDLTDHTDQSCQTYSFTTPEALHGGQHVVILLSINFPTNSDYMRTFGATFTLSPSAEPPVLAPEPDLHPDLDVPSGGSDEGSGP